MLVLGLACFHFWVNPILGGTCVGNLVSVFPSPIFGVYLDFMIAKFAFSLFDAIRNDVGVCAIMLSECSRGSVFPVGVIPGLSQE